MAEEEVSWKEQGEIMAMYRVAIAIGALIMATMMSACDGDSSKPTSGVQTPATYSVEWTGRTGALVSWGGTDSGFYAVVSKGDGEPLEISMWRWEGSSVTNVRNANVNAKEVLCATGNGTVCAVSKKDDPCALEIIDVSEDAPKASWPVPEGWWAPCAGISSNTEYIGILMVDFPGTAGEKQVLHQYRVSVLDVRTRTLTSKAEVSAEVEGFPPATVVVSDNGRYAAVIGWDNGIGMFDMQTSSMLWSGRPKEEVRTRAAAFSSHLDRIYTAGTEGAVYEIDVKTGKVLDKWWASPTGTSEYGHRANCLAISDDGKWLAVGTGPEGRVYMRNLKNPGSDAKLVPHGEGTIYALSFSPDGSHLATVGGGYLKTWKIGE